MGLVLLAAILTVVVMAAQYASFTYVVELLPTGTDPATFLVLFGASGVAGLFLVGLWGRWLDRVLLVILTLLTIAVVLAATVAPWPVTAVVWGVAFGGVPPLLQAKALGAAPHHLAQVAASLMSASFQVGILIGSLAGGAALATGNWRGPLFVSIGLIAVGFVLAIVPGVLGRRAGALRSAGAGATAP
jgi:predicted MFS family arabinose efflux permease